MQELPHGFVELIQRVFTGVAEVGNVEDEPLGNKAAFVEVVPDNQIFSEPSVRCLHGK